MQVTSGLPLQLARLQETHRRSWSGISYLDLNPASRMPVLLLHGLGTNGLSWGFQAVPLAEAGYRPLAVDIPGFGESPPPARGRWTIELIAGRLAEFLAAVGSVPAHVVGLSLGGAVAQVLALEYPDLIARLVLVNSFACLRPKKAGEWAYLLRRLIVANLRGHAAQAETVAWRLFPRPEQNELRALLITTIRSTDPAVYRSAMRALIFFDSRLRLKSVRAPTLVISGNADTTVGLPVQNELVRLIPGAQQVMIPSAGHAAPVDHPEIFNRALLDFLGG